MLTHKGLHGTHRVDDHLEFCEQNGKDPDHAAEHS